MRFLPTRVHGALDHLTGALLIALPYLLGFADGTSAQWVPMALGVGAIAYSLATDYEWGVAPLLPMRAHLALDAASGALLAASPWLFGFHERVWLPHLVLGLFEVAAALVTRTRPATAEATAAF